MEHNVTEVSFLNEKGKLIPVKDHATKMYIGIEVKLHTFLTSELDGVSVTSELLPQVRRLGGTQGRSGRGTENKNSCTAGNRTPVV
jgi:hypothetical protein